MIGPTGSLQLSHVTGGANVAMSIPNGIRFIQTDCNEIGQDVDVVTGGPYPSVTHLGDGLWVGTNQPRQIKGDIDPSAGAGYAAPQASTFQSTNGNFYLKIGPADADWVVIIAVVSPPFPFNGTPTDIESGDAGTPGGSPLFARGDHEHPVPAPATVTGIAAQQLGSIGASTKLAREDHQHATAAATPVDIAQANVEGASPAFARADHVHNHAAQPLGTGTNHAIVTPNPGGIAGFMSPADKTKLDGLDSDLMLYTVFVAKNGDDGTADGSPTHPFLTIQAAMDYAWTTYVVPAEPQPSPPFRRPCVFVNAGTYDDGPLVLPPQICVMGEGFNHTRIVGAWTLDNRWSNYVPPSLPSPPSVLVPSDFRSSFIGVGIFSPITFDFGAVFSNEGKIYAAGCRFAGVVTITEKTVNPVSNSFNVQACEFIAPVVLEGIPSFIQNSTFLSSLTINQLVGTGVDNVFASFGSSFADIIINSTSGLAPAYDLAFSHSVQSAATLTLNGTFITVRGTIDSLPLQSNIILLGGAVLDQITRINQPFFSGTTAQRPSAPYVGQEFFDTTLGQTVWWDGAAWVTWGATSGGDVFVWGNDNVGAAADTRYFDPGRGGVASTSAATRQVPISRAGTVKSLFVRHNSAAGNGNSVVYTVAKNGVATAITVTLATGAVGQASDLVNTFAVAAGDRISLVGVKALGIGGGGVDMQATVEIV
jgi:hypothetical protein